MQEEMQYKYISGARWRQFRGVQGYGRPRRGGGEAPPPRRRKIFKNLQKNS